MARPAKIPIGKKFMTSITLEADSVQQLEEYYGKGMISEITRDLHRKEVERIRKKDNGQTRIDPLNLSVNKDEIVIGIKEPNLFEFIATKDLRNEICKYIDSIKNMVDLDVLYRNCNTVTKMILTRKQQNSALASAQLRNSIPSNTEIIMQMKRAKRGIPI